MTRVLVTGAAGFIGFHLARRLLADGHEVIGLDNLNAYYEVSLKEARLARLQADGLSFHRIDLADRAAMEAVFRSTAPEIVVNLAAQAGVRYSLENPHAYVRSNVDGFLNVLEGCRHHGVRHLVFASSSSVYGANTRMPFATDHTVDHPVSLYAATKKANELMAHTYSHLYGIPSTGLRFFTVYGPWGRPDMAYFLFTRAILDGRPINVFGEGELRRDFTYIDDIIEGVVRVMARVPTGDPEWSSDRPTPNTSSAPYRLYNIGNHSPVRVMDMIATLERTLGRKADKRFMPMQQGDVVATFADVADLERDIDFQPVTPLETGLQRFVDWYLEYQSGETTVPRPALPQRDLAALQAR